MRRIYRRPLRSLGANAASPREQVEHCLREGVTGLGWALDPPAPTTLDEALRRTRARPDWKGAEHTIRRFANAPQGSLVWTRGADGRFHLGEISGPWRYDASAEAARVDVHHVRPTVWAPSMLAESVPGAVIRAFSRQGSSFSQIHNDAARLYSGHLFDTSMGRAAAKLRISRATVLHSYLDPIDVEDLVYVFLQVEEGYIVLPASRRTDTKAYEYELIQRDSGQRAVIQVKTGDSRVALAEVASAAGPDGAAFAYATGGGYDGPADCKVRRLRDEELLAFARTYPALLPGRVRHWFEVATEDTI
jgi:hypothetical protein